MRQKMMFINEKTCSSKNQTIDSEEKSSSLDWTNLNELLQHENAKEKNYKWTNNNCKLNVFLIDTACPKENLK